MIENPRMLHFIVLICLVVKTQGMEEFTFTDTPFTMDGWRKVSPKFERLKKMEVAPINSNVKTNMKLSEFILLNVDFNYLSSVPSSKRMTFTMPDM